MSIELGLCCINTELRAQKPSIFNSRTVIRKNYSVEKAIQLARQNIADIIPMLEYNNKHGIKCLRLSSDILPRFTDDKVESYDINILKEDFEKVALKVKELGIKLLMHPGQYNQVGSADENVFRKTCEELHMHASILDLLEVPYEDGQLIVHGGGTYQNKEKTIERWVDNFFRLPENVQRRLAIENDERQYSLDDVVYISRMVYSRGMILPVIFDSHHYDCYNIINPGVQSSYEKLLPYILESFPAGIKPVCHISNQGSGKIGHHSDYIEELHSSFYWILENNYCIYLEVEAKLKEKAIFHLREKYEFLK